uniref:Uncharacterized protein n=1 Tax=Arundo donax TaxID=35708 RepID=A0A0A9AL36_ARUDO
MVDRLVTSLLHYHLPSLYITRSNFIVNT